MGALDDFKAHRDGSRFYHEFARPFDDVLAAMQKDLLDGIGERGLTVPAL